MTKRIALLLGLAVASVHSAELHAETHKRHRSSELGFAVTLPRDVRTTEHKAEDGWRGMQGTGKSGRFFALALPGKKLPAALIREKAEALSGLKRERWKVLRTVKGKRGWVWYCTARARQGKQAAFAVYGIGPRGAYLFVRIAGSKKGTGKRNAAWARKIILEGS